jgi:hypothetical protein
MRFREDISATTGVEELEKISPVLLLDPAAVTWRQFDRELADYIR